MIFSLLRPVVLGVGQPKCRTNYAKQEISLLALSRLCFVIHPLLQFKRMDDVPSINSVTVSFSFSKCNVKQ